MQAIRKKIRLVVMLLAAAIAVCVAIYSKGGFSVAAPQEEYIGFCGNTGFTESLSDTARQGKTLFQANCASCHAMNKDLIGPALAGVMERLPSKELMEEILWYPDRTFKKNKYAKTVYKKYSGLAHTNFSEVLTKEDINALIAYFNQYKEHAYPEIMAMQ